jgi:RNA polymerase sigma-70 factor (ECF subfamily)
MGYQLLADDKLLELLKTSDPGALREIYRRHWRPCYLHAIRKVRAAEVAEELVQNLFVSLWERRGDLHVSDLGSYLYTAMKYQIVSYIRASIAREKYLRGASQQAAHDAGTGLGANDAETPLLLHELSEAIEAAIVQLPEKSRQVFRLSRFEHRSNREISQSMDISEKAVEYHITQSLKLLRVQLKDFIFLFF